MHHSRSASDVRSFRCAAALLLAGRLCAPITAGLLAYSVVTGDRQAMILGVGLVVLTGLLVILQWIASSSTGCPLCRTAVLAPKACTKHRRARTVLGSHRLRVAAAILLKNRFRCPYCNESTSMKIRTLV